jgi:hypothetical protein
MACHYVKAFATTFKKRVSGMPPEVFKRLAGWRIILKASDF